jgi:hypothetical protein
MPAELLPPHVLERLGGLEFVARGRRGLRRRRTAPLAVPRRGGGVRAPPRVPAGRRGAPHRLAPLRAHRPALRARVPRDSNLQAYLVVDATLSMGYADATASRSCATPRSWRRARAPDARAGDAVGLASWQRCARSCTCRRATGAASCTTCCSSWSGSPRRAMRSGSRGRRRGGGRAAPPRPRGVISDLLEDDDGAALLAALGRLRARGDEVIVLRVLTPAEWRC